MEQTKRNTLEWYTEWYFEELKDHGIIFDWIREPETLETAPVVQHPMMKYFKRKDDEQIMFNLFPKMKYTYDYKVIWNPEYRYIFYDILVNEYAHAGYVLKYGKPIFVANEIDGQHVSMIDTKPTSNIAGRGGNLSSSVTFAYKRRLIWDHHKLYIEKFVPIPMSGAGKLSARFPNTFTPKRYMMTDGGRQLRKIKFPIQNLNGFLIKRKAWMVSHIPIK